MKWIPIGSVPLYATVPTLESLISTTYAALPTPGPSITLPVAGIWDIELGSHAYCSAVATFWHSYDVGGTAAVDADGIQFTHQAGFYVVASSWNQRKFDLLQTTLTSKYKTSAGSGYWTKRWMRATPVLLG